MKRIRIEYFKSLDNYGTGMMGLVTVAALARRFGPQEVEFHCDFADQQALEEVRSELPDGADGRVLFGRGQPCGAGCGRERADDRGNDLPGHPRPVLRADDRGEGIRRADRYPVRLHHG